MEGLPCHVGAQGYYHGGAQSGMASLRLVGWGLGYEDGGVGAQGHPAVLPPAVANLLSGHTTLPGACYTHKIQLPHLPYNYVYIK